MNDRDHFAAAALTGLLARVGGAARPPDEVTVCAWNWADAMLAARGTTTDHDAVPAATAIRDAALALYEVGQWVSPDVPAAQADAMWATLRDALGLPVGHATARGVAAAPPAASLTLTDAEREAVRECAHIARSQLRSAEEGGDRETIARWRRRVFAITGLLARAAKEEGR